VNDAATAGARTLIDQLFGDPVDDADLASRKGGSQEKAMARCQLEMLERTDRIAETALSALNRARKKAIKDETVNSGAALEAVLNIALESDEVAKAAARLVKAVERKCAPPLDPEALFPGACSDPSSRSSPVRGSGPSLARGPTQSNRMQRLSPRRSRIRRINSRCSWNRSGAAYARLIRTVPNPSMSSR
jgi:hypothetical protein